MKKLEVSFKGVSFSFSLYQKCQKRKTKSYQSGNTRCVMPETFDLQLTGISNC